MENYCTSLELSKELAKNGFKTETKFWWVKYDCGDMKEHWELRHGFPLVECKKIPAPLSDELLEELPPIIKHNLHLQIEKDLSEEWEWSVCYYSDLRREIMFNDKSLPNALAQMWLYLKKQGLLK